MRRSGKIWSSIIGALPAAALFAAMMGDSAAQTGPEQQGKTKCTLGINNLTFPSLAASKNAQGMTGNSSFSVNCSGYPAWITPKGGGSGGMTNTGLPFCVTLRANGADASFTAAGQRVLYRDGRPDRLGSGNDLTFNFYTNYRDCAGSPGKQQAPFCIWGASDDATDYGTGYPSFMFSSGLAPNHVDNNITLNYGAQIDPGQELFAGTYSNSFTATLYYNDYRFDSSAAGHYNPGNAGVVMPSELCLPEGQHFKGTRMATSQIMVTGTVKASCTSVTPPSVVNLGSVTRMQDIKQQTGIIKVSCSAGIPYQIGISKGNNSTGDPATGGWRGVGCATPDTCGNQVIYYNIYKDAGESQIWGDIGSGNALRANSASVPFYADVAPVNVQSSLGAAMPPQLGTYKDVLIVTLQSMVKGTTQ